MITRYQAEPGNVDPEALPRIFKAAFEAEPLDIGSQAEPGNQLKPVKHALSIRPAGIEIPASKRKSSKED